MDMQSHTLKRTLICLLLAALLAVTGLFASLEAVYADESAEGEAPAAQENTENAEESFSDEEPLPAASTEQAEAAEEEAAVAEEEVPGELPAEATEETQAAEPATEEAAVAPVEETPKVVKNGIYKENGKYYYYKNDVVLKNQWVTKGNNKYYASANGSFYVNRFFSVKGARYYATASGAVRTGRFKIGKSYYYALPSGSTKGKIQTGWFKAGGKSYYANAAGVIATSRWLKKNGKKYYATGSGAFATGTFKVKGKYYHGTLKGANQGQVRTGWFTDNGKKYVADANGVLYRNQWRTKGSKRYHTDGNGALIVNATKAYGGVKYKFDKNGAMVRQRGWGSYNGKVYYKDASGFPVKNRLMVRGGKTYYLGSNGLSITGWKKINGNYLHFNKKTCALESNRTAPFNSAYKYNGTKLTAWRGVVYGPSGRETYYNMRMGGVVSIMRRMGFSASAFPYWVRSDGCKMLGPYIMVAAHLGVHPRGSVVPTSRGLGLVCDTGGFAYRNSRQLDIAVSW